MDGQQLHRVGLARRGHVEALAELVLCLQPRHQRGQGDRTVDRLELRHRLHEQVEVVAPGGRGRTDRGGELDVDAGGVDDAAHQVEDRLADRRPQPAQLGREEREPLPRLRRVGEVSGLVDRVTERGDLGRVGSLDGGGELGAHVGEGAAPTARPGQLAGPATEQGQVAHPDRPPRSVEQGQHRGVVGDVLDQGQSGHHLADLGQPQQALEADDLDRHLSVGERVEDGGGVGVVAGEHPDLLPRPCRPRDRPAPGRRARRARGPRSRARRRAPLRDRRRASARAAAARVARRTAPRARWLAVARMRSSERRLTVSG